MNNFDDRINQYINTHPKECLQMAFVLCLFWMSSVAVLGLILYLILSKKINYSWWTILGFGTILAGIILLGSSYLDGINPKAFFMNGFTLNKYFWKLFITRPDYTPLIFMWHYTDRYIMGFPILFAGILSTIDLINENPHKSTIHAIQKGEHYQEKKDLPVKKINKALQQLSGKEANGILLGVSTYTAKSIVIPDHYINQIALVLGTTGSGKTITLQRFHQRAITKGYPLILIDGKPTQSNIRALA